MSKIAIISQPDKGVLIDVGGCNSLTEATQHLTSTLQISSEFWRGCNVDLNLGSLSLSQEEVVQVIAIAKEVGVNPKQVFSQSEATKTALKEQNITIGTGMPMCLPKESSEVATTSSLGPPATSEESTLEDIVSSSNDIAQVNTTNDINAQASNLSTLCTTTVAGNQTEQQTPLSILYLRQTLRSGQVVSHKGHLVIVGDVNPGAEVIADGDITVWGALRGVAHAGINGNTQAEIRALRLQPIQIRIAHAIARSPDRPGKILSTHKGPETARIVGGAIRIIANNPD